jgi:enediyne biosynthesis protein CalE3
LRAMNQRLLQMHQVMLSDSSRVQAYDEALRQAVRPGNVVVDVGAGTLILSVLALRHGARHVYAIEADPEVCAVAQRLAEGNRLHGRLTLIHADARTVRLPEPADVIVSEMMGNLGPEEEMAEIVGTVARNNLRPGGRIVPERVTTFLQAIAFDREGWGVWDDTSLGYSLAPVRDSVAPAAQMHFFHNPPTLLSEPTVLAEQSMGDPSADRDELLLEISSAGTLHAIAGYFTATLASGVHLSNFPSYPGCNWAVWIWPVRHTSVVAGDAIAVGVRRPADVRSAVGWTLDCQITRQALQ